MEYTEYELEDARNQKMLFDNIIDTCVIELEGQIRKAIKERWKTADSVNGGKITSLDTGEGYARLSYKNLKLKINPSGSGNVDLTLTGALGDGLKLVKTETGDYEVISTDSKYQKIGIKYGFDEFGLDADEMVYFMKQIEDRINNKIII
jgi:hypothetical protein